MHLSLSDLVTCPRCGPIHGLVLLPSSVSGRRVETGVLGCANCRQRYRIEGGVVDLRLAGSTPADAGGGGSAAATGASDGDAATRLAALLGLTDARGPVLLAGPASAHAAALARLLVQVEVVVLVGDGEAPPAAGAAGDGVTYLMARGVIPLRSGALAAAALTGPGTALAEEALRAVRPTARVLLDPIEEGLEARAAAAGGTTVLSEGATLLVARRV